MGILRLPDGTVFNISGASRTSGAAKSAAPSPRPQGRANGASATAARKETDERIAKADALIKQAREWKQRAIDGRASLDREVRELLVAKSSAAIAEAERLLSGDMPDSASLAKSASLKAEAERFDRQALSAGDSELRQYYRERARDLRDEAEGIRKESSGQSGNITADNHEAAADEYRERARKAETSESRRYFYDKAREFDARAAQARNGNAVR